MSKVTLEDYRVPNTCGECGFIGYYESGPYARNPHCCCELMWQLKEEDYEVDKNLLDENCPLKIVNINTTADKIGITKNYLDTSLSYSKTPEEEMEE